MGASWGGSRAQPYRFLNNQRKGSRAKTKITICKNIGVDRRENVGSSRERERELSLRGFCANFV